MKTRNRYLPWLILVLAILALAFTFLRLRTRVQHIAVYPAQGELISINGNIGITFNQPMNAPSVEDLFTIQPKIAGQFNWEGNTLWFIPDDQLVPTQIYQAAIAHGAEAENGRKLRRSLTWQAVVREPDIIYLVLDTSGGDLYRYELASGRTFPLTDTNATIIDFSANPTGDRIAYARANSVGGSDLWLIDRQGNDPQLLLDCDKDQCTQLSWSANSEWIAYERASFDQEAERYLPSRVWTINSQNGQTAPIYRQETAYGHSPSFSPDGKRLATYDSVQNAIRIIELDTSQESAIPTAFPGVGDWSPDGEELIFIDLVPGVLEPNVSIYIVNFIDQNVREALGEFIPNMDYDPPQWSPDGEWIAYGTRPVGAGISKGIWIKNLAGGDPFPITDEPSATFSNYRWDPWGERLVFQRYPISGPISNASIWQWERSTGETRLLIENGARPEWLP